MIANEKALDLVPGWGGRISAELVWDGTDEVRIPAAMGTPRADQMQGTARERLVELAGRICYDSLGTGRASGPYHENIRTINHGALWEHAAFTVEIRLKDRSDWGSFALLSTIFMNRPGVHVRPVDDVKNPALRVTMNLRHVVEWASVRGVLPVEDKIGHGVSFSLPLVDTVEALAPKIVLGCHALIGNLVVRYLGDLTITSMSVVEPEVDEEKWVSLYVSGSRGFSHELVRHGDWTAISQRSTRYVDESESEWVLHPLLEAWFKREPGAFGGLGMSDLSMLANDARRVYDQTVTSLEPWLVSRGVDKFSARKQARGAARIAPVTAAEDLDAWIDDAIR